MTVLISISLELSHRNDRNLPKRELFHTKKNSVTINMI